MNGATVSVETDGEGRENRRAIAVRVAVERLADMLQAGLNRNPMAGKKRELGRAMRQALKRGETILDRQLANRIHPGVEVQWGEALPAVADVGDAQAHLRPYVREWIACHGLPPVNGGSPKRVKERLQRCVG
jgi:hypothetical protein